MLYYVWHDRFDGFDRFYSIKGKEEVDVYPFTPRHDLISLHDTTCNARHE